MTKAHLAAVASIGAAAIAAAGCGSGGGGSSSSSAAPASSAPKATPSTKVVAKKTSVGTILTSGTGRTLYMFEKDSGPKSNCSGACTSDWPPFTATSTPAVGGGAAKSDVKLIKRTDGQMQVAYKNHPLYFFSGDKSPGQMNGQGLEAFGAEWYVLSPSGSKVEGGEHSSKKEDKSSSSSSSSSSGGYGGY